MSGDSELDHERAHQRRDDRARIAALQDDLKVAEQTIAKLERETKQRGRRSTADQNILKRAGDDPTWAPMWLGAPALLKMTKRFSGKLPEDRFDELVERVREITHDPGTLEIKPGKLVWSSSSERHPVQAQLMVRVKIEHASTHLIVTDRLGALVGRLFGAFGSVIAAGGLALPVAASLAFPILSPVFVIGWLGTVFGATRTLYRKLATTRAKLLHETFGALVLEIEPYLKR